MVLSVLFVHLFHNLVSINLMEWSTIPACPSLVHFLTRAILKGISLGTCVLDVCIRFVLFCFVLVFGLSCTFDLSKGLHEMSFKIYICL